mgnify:CR=1 FL=1
MTLKELSQLYHLKREIGHDRERLAKLRARRGSVSSPKLDGLPSSAGGGQSAVENLALEIADLEAIIDSKIIQCVHEQNRLERYIAGIPDSRTRMIMSFRFVDGFSWGKVAYKVGGGNTASVVKMTCYRYLKKEKKEV